jgi:putative ABC transport system substrate-binding protein
MDRVRADAADLINGKPDVILVAGRRAVAVLQQQTRTIPVVFSGFVNPVEQGIVPNLARPGGNITGFAFGELSVTGKMLEMLKQMAPNITRVAFRFQSRECQCCLHFTFVPRACCTARDQADPDSGACPGGNRACDRKLCAPSEWRPVVSGRRNDDDSPAIVTAQVARLRLPAIYADPVLVTGGGLMFYGPDRVDIFRRSASYVDRILRGEKPGDLRGPAADQISGW